MSLTPIASATMFNSAFTSGTGGDSCAHPTLNSVVVVETQVPSLRLFNLSTCVQTLSTTVLTAPKGVTMITNTSAAVVSSTLSTVDLVEIATGYRQNYAGGTVAIQSQAGQIIAGDPSTGIAFAIANATNTLVKINGNNFTITSFKIASLPGIFLNTIILKSPGRWLVGDTNATIYEIDSFGNIIDAWDTFLGSFPLGRISPSGGTNTLTIRALSYDNNLLLIGVDTKLLLMDWSTKTILKCYDPGGTTTTRPITFCQASSGITIVTPINNTQGVLMEVDQSIQPLTIRDQIYLDVTTQPLLTGINPVSGYGWWIDASSRLRTFAISPRASTTKLITVQSASSAGGVDQQARLTIIDDTSGAGTSFVVLDTYMQSPGTYRIPTGRTLMEITKVGLGSVASWDVSRYNS